MFFFWAQTTIVQQYNQKSEVKDLLCLHVEDPATIPPSNYFLGTLFSFENRLLFSYWKNKYLWEFPPQNYVVLL